MGTATRLGLTKESISKALSFYFPRSFTEHAGFFSSEAADILIKRLCMVEEEPLSQTHFNQLLHLTGEAGFSEGFFKYYFLSQPEKHVYSMHRLLPAIPDLGTFQGANAISSLEQLIWGLHRFFLDALLCFGDIRFAYDSLRQEPFEDIARFFGGFLFNPDQIKARGPVLPFYNISPDDSYLIAEMACKAFSPLSGTTVPLVEDMLLKAYREAGGGRIEVKKLFDKETKLAHEDPQAQMMLEFSTEEFAEDMVTTEAEIREKVAAVAKRFVEARKLALGNTRLYLSIVNELDVYVATSMRRRSDFRDMGRDCARIFKSETLKDYRLRYFDPTISAAEKHEDKGLIECLMVKCAKALVYFAGESDSFGKDSEVAAALSLGKPVIILCPATPKGEQRMRFFRDIHPLSRMVQFETGVAIGAMVTNDPTIVAELLKRIFTNQVEYDLDQQGDGFWRLRERLTQSVVRVQTNDRILRESFWNYYHKRD